MFTLQTLNTSNIISNFHTKNLNVSGPNFRVKMDTLKPIRMVEIRIEEIDI